MLDQADLIAAVLTGDYREVLYGCSIRGGNIRLRLWYKDGDHAPKYIKFITSSMGGNDIGIAKHVRTYYIAHRYVTCPGFIRERHDEYQLISLNGKPFLEE